MIEIGNLHKRSFDNHLDLDGESFVYCNWELIGSNSVLELQFFVKASNINFELWIEYRAYLKRHDGRKLREWNGVIKEIHGVNLVRLINNLDRAEAFDLTQRNSAMLLTAVGAYEKLGINNENICDII